MNDLARLGAQTRLAQLAAEIDSIRQIFPDLGGSPGKKRGRPDRRGVDGDGQPSSQYQASVVQAEALATTRKRKPMSAAAKKAVGERMKKYWAEKRKAAGAPATESTAETKPAKAAASHKRTMSAEARAKIGAAQKKRWAAQRRAGKKR